MQICVWENTKSIVWKHQILWSWVCCCSLLMTFDVQIFILLIFSYFHCAINDLCIRKLIFNLSSIYISSYHLSANYLALSIYLRHKIENLFLHIFKIKYWLFPPAFLRKRLLPFPIPASYCYASVEDGSPKIKVLSDYSEVKRRDLFLLNHWSCPGDYLEKDHEIIIFLKM